MSDSNSQQPRERKSRLNKKLLKLIIIIVVSIIVLGGIVFGVWYIIDTNNKNQQISEQSKLLDAAQKSFNNYNEAQKIAASGDYQAGQVIIDDEIKNTTNKIDQASLYLQKSSIALNSGKYDDAYNFAKKSEELNPTIYSARLMADAAVKKGDKADAIIKYQLAINRITGKSEVDELDKQEIQNIIKQLEVQL